MGFRRRVLYAPLKETCASAAILYLRLANPIADGQKSKIKKSGREMWAANHPFRPPLIASLEPGHSRRAGSLRAGASEGDGGLSWQPRQNGTARRRRGRGGNRFFPERRSMEGGRLKLIEAKRTGWFTKARLTQRRTRAFPFHVTCSHGGGFQRYKVPGEYRADGPGPGRVVSLFHRRRHCGCVCADVCARYLSSTLRHGE